MDAIGFVFDRIVRMLFRVDFVLTESLETLGLRNPDNAR